MDKKHETFTYTYSAARQEEVRRIREKYAAQTPEETAIERLRKLDKSTTKPGRIAAGAVGVLSTLVMGFGMSCTMVWGETLFIPGVLIGAAGILGVCAAYPLYICITKKRRERLAPEILRLSDELMK